METKCDECDRTFASEEALEMHNKSKHEKIKKPIINLKTKKRIRNWTIFIVLVILSIWGFSNLNIAKKLPPTTMQGHIEANPESHIMKVPMELPVHKHMLEHSDGTGRPGIIINYNCKDYECEPDLIEKLESIVEEYPDFLYVAPFPKMDTKIALTKLGKIKTLNKFDRKKIEAFIFSK